MNRIPNGDPVAEIPEEQLRQRLRELTEFRQSMTGDLNRREFFSGVDTCLELLTRPLDTAAPPGGIEPGEPRCRICGCTDDRACEGGCFWIEEDLCSACLKTATVLESLRVHQAQISIVLPLDLGWEARQFAAPNGDLVVQVWDPKRIRELSAAYDAEQLDKVPPASGLQPAPEASDG